MALSKEELARIEMWREGWESYLPSNWTLVGFSHSGCLAKRHVDGVDLMVRLDHQLTTFIEDKLLDARRYER